MIKKVSVVMAAIVTLALLQGAIADGSFADFKVGMNGAYPLLTWRMSSEDGVTGFMVERSSDAMNYFAVATFNQPEGAGKTYRYTDTNVFKQGTRTFYYRIRVLQIDGTYWHSGVHSIQVSQSGLRQTWGSIKALFR